MSGKRPEILDCCQLPRERIKRCLARLELALSRANIEECRAAIEDAFRVELPDPVTLESPLVALGIDHRTVNTLENQSIFTVGDLCQASETSLLRISNIGKVAVREIISLLSRHGLKLRDQSKFSDRV